MDHHHLPGSPSRTPRSFGPPTFPFQQMLELQHHHSHHHGDTASMPQQQLSEDDENSPNRSSSVDKQQQQQQQQQHKSSKKSSAAASGSGELAVRKPRGRPPGSKNKPKPPIIITRDTGSGMRPHVLEVAPGTDLVEAIAGFARRKQRGVVVLSAKGSVTNITLLRQQQQQQQPQQPQQQQQQQSPQPSRSSSPPSSSSSPPPPPSTVTYNGRFELLSMSGAFLQQLPGSMVGFSNIAISVAGGPQGQVIGGNVAGPLLAATPVVVIATSFLGPTYERLPLDEQDEQEEVHRQQQQSQALQGTTPIPIHQLMNDPFGLHHPGLASQLPPGDVLASWAAAAAAAASGVRPPL